MIRRCSFMLLLIFVALQGVQAQSDDFKAFRERMLSDYSDFRKGIMNRYEEFLDAAWAEYETMAGRRRVTQPKPVSPPVYTPPTKPVEPVKVTPKEPEPVVPIEPIKKIEPTDVPTGSKAPNRPVIPKAPDAPVVPSPTTPQIRFELYGLQLAVPAPKIEATLHSANQQDVIAFWKQIKRTDTRQGVDILQQHVVNYRLGDWCTFKAVEAYSRKWAKGNKYAERVMMQYLMLSMEYDVRMAIADGEIYLMLPFEQQVYGNTYLTVGNIKYYIYPNDLPNGSSIYSCAVPSDVDCGRQMNLIINPAYLLPKEKQPFTISHDALTIQGHVNKNVIALQQEYPTMDVYCYAASVADEELRKSVISQLNNLLQGMSELEAANILLRFVQKGFEYQTDGQQFGQGVEKSFFFDETLYFPYCDCEDRSIFYAYLIRELLGLDVLLVSYPGHECTAVALSSPPPTYTSFQYKGKTYYICDPTYIGADIGMCMPDFVNIQPEVEEWY